MVTQLLLYHVASSRFKYYSIALGTWPWNTAAFCTQRKLVFLINNLTISLLLPSWLEVSLRIVIWLILPVVIRLSQRLSHACLSIKVTYNETANGSFKQL